MAVDPRPARLAVLIDADNTSPKLADGLFEEIAKLGEASVRRIYGDFSGPRLKGWVDILPKHAILAHQNFANTTGKNASDIALVIDAMDLLKTGRFEGFCLVSSDSDFTRLAARIREEGVDVFGFGERKTPESFRQACRRFIFTENLLPASAREEEPPPAAARKSRDTAAAAALLRKAIDLIESDDGWVSLGELGKRMINLYPDFDPRTYGHAKLSNLIANCAGFELDRSADRRLRARLRPAAGRATKAART